MDSMPSLEEDIASAKNYYDNFYPVPDYVSEFLENISKLLPKGHEVKPRTIARLVTLFFLDKPIHCLNYEDIKDNPEYATTRLLGKVILLEDWQEIISSDIGQLRPLPTDGSIVLFVCGVTYYAGYYVCDSGDGNGFYCNIPNGSDFFIPVDDIKKWRYV